MPSALPPGGTAVGRSAGSWIEIKIIYCELIYCELEASESQIRRHGTHVNPDQNLSGPSFLRIRRNVLTMVTSLYNNQSLVF
jgi:hypothetical protein